jgi:5-methylcytosine-specific restriction endonuclease McrA
VSGPDNLSKLDRLRARDGDKCWLCDDRLDFEAEPNSSRAPSVEHLIAKSRGGPESLENFVLCHTMCNRQLAARPLTDKIKMRERRGRKRLIATLRSQWRIGRKG